MFRLKTFIVMLATGAALLTLRPEPPLELPRVNDALTADGRPKPPAYVLPLLAVDANGGDYAAATGFVVDRERGLVTTAAHTNVGKNFRVLLADGTWLPLTRVRVNRDADVALLALPEGMGAFLPEGPLLRSHSVTALEPTVAWGWRISSYRGIGNIRYRPSSWPMGVLRPAANMCKMWPGSCVERLQAVMRGAKDGKIRKEDRYLWYDRFIVLVDVHNEAHVIPFGMSGGPIINERGSVIGVLVSSNGYFTFAAPIDEVKKLMR